MSKIRFVDPGIMVNASGESGGSSISSSYALTASYADFATSASYAVSASYEIIKEVSSSYADTASFAQSGNGIFSGSFSGSLQGNGSGLTNIPSSGIIGLPTVNGTANTIPIFTGTNAIGNSTITYDGEGFTANIPGGLFTFQQISGDYVRIFPSQNLISTDGNLLILEGSKGVTLTDGADTATYEGGGLTLLGGGLGSANQTLIRNNGDIEVTPDGGGLMKIQFPSNGLAYTYSLPTATGTIALLNNSGSGDFQATGSFTGSFQGDGSELIGVISSSYSTTASYVETAQTASYILNAVSSSYAITASHALNTTQIPLGTVSGSAQISSLGFVTSSATASFVTNSQTSSMSVLSSSFAVTASHLLNNPPPFPFTGDASITGSLTISGSFNAFRLNTTDVILGEGAGALSTVNGPRNVMVGYQAGYTNTSGDDNVAVGYKAGYGLHNNASDANVFIGKLSGAGGTSGTGRMSSADNNIGIGVQSLLFLTSGDNNIGIGYFAMRNMGSGAYNLALGTTTLYNTSTGQNNIGVGYYAGFNQTTGNGNITIGSGSLGIAGESNQLRIGNGESVTVISASLATGEILLNTTTISGSLLNTGTVSIDHTDSPYTITGTQQFILIDPSGGDVTVNMPDASTYPGRQIFFKLTQAAGANTVTLQRQGSDTIDGATSYAGQLDIQYESISTVSDGGTGWFIF